MRRKEDAMIKFWRQWDAADIPEQEKMCKRLLVLDAVNDKKLKSAFAGILNTYFQDLREYMLTAGCKRK